MVTSIDLNIKNVKNRITQAAEKSGRSAEQIVLVGVTKKFPSDLIKMAIEFGITDIGESRVQEAEYKINELGPIAAWHLIGHLQTNKAKKAVQLFDLIHSVDSIKLAEEINRQGEIESKKVNCLIEVNSSGEESKFGFDFNSINEALEKVNKFEFINLKGLMTIGPYTNDIVKIREAFIAMKKLFESSRKIYGESFSILSMGMSSDYELAIEEGSTLVRVGTALFGSRPT